ncbi:hypothetical protein DH2020_047818 [Rehmannia glutinosa]|uniref:Uncharacterized protein n=1 Tax=Rehmannia glutinosa TaxID=99300 RepID=A0ABR0U7E8_REHGL
MLKFKLARQLRCLLVPSVPHNSLTVTYETLLFPISSLFTASQNRTCTSTPHLNPKNSLLVNYLTDSLKFPKTQAIAISTRFSSSIDSTEKPEATVRYLKALGFSDTQLLSSIKRQPTILFADVEKTLKPKVTFYQELGLCGPRLGILISKNPALLTSSLDKKLKPSIGVIKKVLELDGTKTKNNDISDLMFRILSRYAWVIGNDSRLQSNIIYLRRCGVIGSQLIMLLKTEPRLFSIREEELKNLVSRAIGMGFEMGSRMLVYGILALYCNSAETINRKFELLRKFGFSRDDCNLIFVKSPALFKVSEAKLRRGIEFFTHTLMLDKSVLVGSPFLLMFSVEKRMIPRFKFLETIKSRGLLGKQPSFITVLIMPDKEFVEKFISRFEDDAKELKVAYENHLLESSEV